MSVIITFDRLSRAVTYISEFHSLSVKLSEQAALRILRRTNELCELERMEHHPALRVAAAEQAGIRPERAVYYRKAIAAYWRFTRMEAARREMLTVGAH